MAEDVKAPNANHQPLGSKPKAGGAKRYNNGPRPARHIPWPEIFKHHISVVEGHLKMIDMVRKHTVEGSGNWNTIVDMIKRTQDMLKMAKDVSRSFVPPPNIRDQVPIGSSSASMYPGYSPADHEYGQAAQEFGAHWSAAKAQGVEFKPEPNGPQYEIGQSRGAKREKLTKIREAKGKREGSISGSGSNTGHTKPKSAESTAPENEKAHPLEEPAKPSETKSEDDTPEESNPYFVIDVNPTPVDLLGTSHQLPKRSKEKGVSPDKVSFKKRKKSKHNLEEAQSSPQVKRVEFEDITEEVDARMNEKEEQKKREEKGDKKRKLEDQKEPQETADGEQDSKRKKRKMKKLKAIAEANGEALPENQTGSDDRKDDDQNSVGTKAEEIVGETGKPKKKKNRGRKHKDASETNGESPKKRKETSDVEAQEQDNPNPRKKKKKAKKIEGEVKEAYVY